MLEGYVEIESFTLNFEAEIAKNLLKDNDIEALIGKDDCGGMMPNLQFVQGVRLYVLPRDVEKSRSVLKTLSSSDSRMDSEAGENTMWKCAKCGTELESQFTECWNCGASRQL